VLSGAYAGPAALTASTALTTWTFDAVALLAVAAAAVAYARGVATVRQGGGRWPGVRVASFAAGLVLVVLATCSAVSAYAHVLFWMYVVQACLLLLVVPLLLGAGAPLTLTAAAAGPRGRARVERWSGSGLARVARLPGFGPAVLIAVTAVLFFTPLMTFSLRSDAGGELVRLGLLTAGLVVALPVTDEHVSLSSVAYAAALGLAFVEFLLDAVPGIVLRLQEQVLQGGYWSVLHRPWGPSPLEDQHLAGAWLWFFGEAGDIPFIAALLVAWVASDAREARAIDAALDAAALDAAAPRDPPAARPPAGAGSAPVATVPPVPSGGSEPAEQDPDRQRPWWETDPSVFGEARARRHGWGAAQPETGSNGRGSATAD
jgi:putative membrane protein